MSNNVMDICFVCNGHNFAINLGITIVSILKNSDLDDSFHFHIITDDMLDEDRENLILLKDIKNFEITFYTPSKDRVDMYKRWVEEAGDKIKSWWSYHVFLKFEVWRILSHLDKVLFLDSDVIILKKIEEIYNSDIFNYDLAAAYSYTDIKNINTDVKWINAGFIYFNINSIKNIMTDDVIYNTFLKLLNTSDNFAEEIILNDIVKSKNLKVKRVSRNFNIQEAIWVDDDYIDDIYIAHCTRGKIYNPNCNFIPKYKNRILKLGWEYLTLTPWFKKDPIHFLELYSKYNTSIIYREFDKNNDDFLFLKNKLVFLINKFVWIIPIKKIRDSLRNKLLSYFRVCN